MSRATIGSARRAARETVHYTKCLKFASEQNAGRFRVSETPAFCEAKLRMFRMRENVQRPTGVQNVYFQQLI